MGLKNWLLLNKAAVAASEAGVDLSRSSEFGCNVPKTPSSWVNEVLRMDHTKKHTFNFLGRCRLFYGSRESWAEDFIRQHFKSHDFLYYTNVRGKTQNYTTKGRRCSYTLPSLD